MRFKTCMQAPAVFLVFAAAAPAAIVRYNFSGELAFPVSGTTSVSGQFSLDTTAATITEYSFTLPGAFGSATGGTAGVSQILPAVDPNTDFTVFSFIPSFRPDQGIFLYFQSPLSALDPDSFYTDVVQVLPGHSTRSRLSCTPPGCTAFLGVGTFASGSLTLVPEPASMTLCGLGLGLLSLALHRRRQL